MSAVPHVSLLITPIPGTDESILELDSYNELIYDVAPEIDDENNNEGIVELNVESNYNDPVLRLRYRMTNELLESYTHFLSETYDVKYVAGPPDLYDLYPKGTFGRNIKRLGKNLSRVKRLSNLKPNITKNVYAKIGSFASGEEGTLEQQRASLMAKYKSRLNRIGNNNNNNNNNNDNNNNNGASGGARKTRKASRRKAMRKATRRN